MMWGLGEKGVGVGEGVVVGDRCLVGMGSEDFMGENVRV